MSARVHPARCSLLAAQNATRGATIVRTLRIFSLLRLERVFKSFARGAPSHAQPVPCLAVVNTRALPQEVVVNTRASH